MGTGLIVVIWVLGDVILGIPVLSPPCGDSELKLKKLEFPPELTTGNVAAAMQSAYQSAKGRTDHVRTQPTTAGGRKSDPAWVARFRALDPGKQFTVVLGVGILVVVLSSVWMSWHYAPAPSSTSTTFPAPPGSSGPAASPAPAPPDQSIALRKISIESWSWRKGGFDNIMMADFVFQNDNPFPVKDLTVECVHSAPSGTKIDQNTRTIYEVIPAHGSKSITNFNMGFIDNQAERSFCHIKDYVAERPSCVLIKSYGSEQPC